MLQWWGERARVGPLTASGHWLAGMMTSHMTILELEDVSHALKTVPALSDKKRCDATPVSHMTFLELEAVSHALKTVPALSDKKRCDATPVSHNTTLSDSTNHFSLWCYICQSDFNDG